MSREIKFRAWDDDTEYMFYSDKPEGEHFFEFKDGKLKGFVIRPPAGSDDPLEPPEPYCDEFDVEQYTGLEDKNGKEDWIDDIIKVVSCGITYYRKIFQADSGAFCIRLPVLGSTRAEGEAMILILIEHENVGNIHENKDLILD